MPGRIIPGTGITLEKGSDRGQGSQSACCCSERELLISQEHDGL